MLSNYKPIDEDERFTENHFKIHKLNDHKYYDCKKSILSNDECELVNNYHDEYLRLAQLNRNNQFKQVNSFKVNTSFFIR
jgi:hypothetical protein